MQRVRYEDRRGAVGRGDDAGGGGVGQVEAEQAGHDDHEEDAELRSGAEQQQKRARQQRAEVDHGADADEQQQWEELRVDTHVEQDLERAGLATEGEDAGVGDVHQDGAQTHGDEQRGLVLLLDAQIHKNHADEHHHDAAGLGSETQHARGKHVNGGI